MALALFGFFACIGLDAPFWVYIIGFICLLIDVGNDDEEELKQEIKTLKQKLRSK